MAPQGIRFLAWKWKVQAPMSVDLTARSRKGSLNRPRGSCHGSRGAGSTSANYATEWLDPLCKGVQTVQMSLLHNLKV